MIPPTAANKKRIIMKHKRKGLPCEEVDGISDMHQRIIGEDGHYYECVICDNGGELLCCDKCPNTYHLQCLIPPFEKVPTGNWKCPHCSERGDLQMLISHFQSPSSEKNKSYSKVNKVVPVDSSQSLHELHKVGCFAQKPMVYENVASANGQKSTAKCNDEGKGTETTIRAQEPKVYRRRHKTGKVITNSENVESIKSIRVHNPSKATNTIHREPIATTSRLLNCYDIQSGHPEQAHRDFKIDILKSKRPDQSLELNKCLVYEQGEPREQLASNADSCMQRCDKNRTDKLLVLRDVMQESMKRDDKFMQDNNKQWGADHIYTEAGRALKEKFAKLRARQKKRLSLRNTHEEPADISGIVGPEPLAQFCTPKFSKAFGVHISSNDLKECATLKTTNKDSGIGCCCNRSADHGYNLKNCSQDHHFKSHLIVPYYWQSKTGQQSPASLSSGAGCSRNIQKYSQEIAIPGVSLCPQHQYTVPHGAPCPWKCSASNISSFSPLGKDFDNMMMKSGNLIKKFGMVDAWFEEEIGAQWRHGQGNWEKMLRDPTLKFLKHKTSRDLSERWKKERQQISMSKNLPGLQSSNPLPGVSMAFTSPTLKQNEPNFLMQQQSQIGLEINSSFPGQSSLSTPGGRKNSRSGFLRIKSNLGSTPSKNQLPLNGKMSIRQTLLLGGSFHLSPIGTDKNQNNDSSETESDPFLAERHEEKDSSSEENDLKC